MTITRSQLTKTTERKMPQGKGTYGSKKGRPPKEARMPRQGKGSKPNPFSAGASSL